MRSQTAQAFLDAVIQRVTPDEAGRSSASRHRGEIEDWLKRDLDIVLLRETGSWRHGTAVAGSSDVDYFVSMRGFRPASSEDALNALRASLNVGLNAYATINRPAVQISFFDGGPKVEVTPAYIQAEDDYLIPDPDGTGWIRSNPAVHLAYVNEAQANTDGQAKGLIRLIKAWKARQSVPLSSFYLEMRTAKYAPRNTPILWAWDLKGVLRSLQQAELADMNDPTDYGRRIGCGANTMGEAMWAKSKLDDAVCLSTSAHEAAQADNHHLAVYYLRDLFNMD